MTDDDEPLELKLARKARDEAEQYRKAAEKDLEQARDERGQAERSLREKQELEASIAKRERALKAAGEPEFLAAQKEAADKLAKAEALMRQYDKDKHAAAIALTQINEREAARGEGGVMPNVRGYESWPFRSLTPRRRSRAPAGRRLSPAEVAAVTERLKAEGKLGPAPQTRDKSDELLFR